MKKAHKRKVHEEISKLELVHPQSERIELPEHTSNKAKRQK